MKILQPKQTGITHVQVVAIIGILLLLASVGLPALLRAREKARRMQCMQKLKSVAEAMITFSNADRGLLPHSGIWEASDRNANGVYDYDELAESWKFAAPQGISSSTGQTPTAGMKYSWVVELLPYLGQQALYDEWNFTASGSWGDYRSGSAIGGKNARIASTNVAVLNCPSDPTVGSGQGNLSYVVNGGYSFHYLNDHEYASVASSAPDKVQKRQINNRKNMGVFFLGTIGKQMDSHRSNLNEISDGASSTVMLVENVNTGYVPPGRRTGIASNDYVANWASPHPCNTSFLINGWGIGVFGLEPYNYRLANVRAPIELTPRIGVNGQAGIGAGGLNSDPYGKCDGNFPYPNSSHPDGVHIASCDGSVLFLNQMITRIIWARIVTPAGGQVVDPRKQEGPFPSHATFEGADGTGGFTQRPLGADEADED